jgi:hypothetical protein
MQSLLCKIIAILMHLIDFGRTALRKEKFSLGVRNLGKRYRSMSPLLCCILVNNLLYLNKLWFVYITPILNPSDLKYSGINAKN